MVLFAGKTVLSMPERFECTTLAKEALYKYSSFTLYPALANWPHYVASSVFCTNSLRCRCYCKPSAHCNKSRDPVDLLDKLCLRFKLRPALQRLSD